LRAYAGAKLANLLFMYELARRLPGASVNAVYPGDVYTNAARNTGPLIRAIYRTIGPLAERLWAVTESRIGTTWG
jgi:retinol dehydrogenase 12